MNLKTKSLRLCKLEDSERKSVWLKPPRTYELKEVVQASRDVLVVPGPTALQLVEDAVILIQQTQCRPQVFTNLQVKDAISLQTFFSFFPGQKTPISH